MEESVLTNKGDIMTQKKFLKMTGDEYNRFMFERFPAFYGHKDDLMQSLMAFGFAFKKGWRELVFKLFIDIEKELKKHPNPEFEIIQKKEKFGGYRCYISCGSEKIFQLIDAAERLSYKTCEECGDKGSLDQRFGWYLTLCRKCTIARGKKKQAEEAARFEQLVAERKVKA